MCVGVYGFRDATPGGLGLLAFGCGGRRPARGHAGHAGGLLGDAPSPYAPLRWRAVNAGHVEDFSKRTRPARRAGRVRLEKSWQRPTFPLRVSSAQMGLTAVFGMGTGVTPSIWPPGMVRCNEQWARPTHWQRENHGEDTNDDQASAAISTGQLSAFRYTRVHSRPIT